jgi:Na+-translocating ferredoxin:NAD+ oxidoreductase RnfE subunit
MKHQSQKIVMLGVARQMLCRGTEVKFQQAPSAGEWEVTSNTTSHTNSCLLIFILPVRNSVNISLLLDVSTVKKHTTQT